MLKVRVIAICAGRIQGYRLRIYKQYLTRSNHRFQSGFFFRHPFLDDFDWYWRLEPDVDYHCDLDYDVFKYMRDNGKKYGK